MENFDNKRSFHRVDAENEAVYKILGETVDLFNSGYIATTTKNISKGGVCLKLKDRIKRGNIVKIGIELSDDLKPINTFCEVAWCSHTEEGYEAGLKFITVGEKQKKHLEDFVRTYN
ncbi:MAG TPA: PilZ domain-containing protein [Firmicutes bacterium]|nr:PilZ domain-containing protein [Bacillota bacterium]